ncbi:hypothetical protein Landi51_08323 [Colletotrichum acutatum]
MHLHEDLKRPPGLYRYICDLHHRGSAASAEITAYFVQVAAFTNTLDSDLDARNRSWAQLSSHSAFGRWRNGVVSKIPLLITIVKEQIDWGRMICDAASLAGERAVRTMSRLYAHMLKDWESRDERDSGIK